MFILILDNDIAVTKGINHTGKLFPHEIEITKEQYNTIKTPCIITLGDGQVISWQETTIVEEITVHRPKIEERLSAVEEAITFLMGV